LRNWLIASANVAASEGGIAFLFPRKLGNSSIALHPSIASRYDANIVEKTPTPGKWWGRDQHQGRKTGRKTGTAAPAKHDACRAQEKAAQEQGCE
jgi:hypothetical protein